MTTIQFRGCAKEILRLAAALFLAVFVAGCGTPGAPSPPSLKLPDKVLDLSAVRTGDQVVLAWTMPKKNTDKLLIKGDIDAHVCRQEATLGPTSVKSPTSDSCVAVPGDKAFAPHATANFTDVLPANLADGPPRPLTYFIELKNSKGRSAGLSNPATVLAGRAPGGIAGLSAQVRKDGVVLHWSDEGNSIGPATAVRLQRKLLTPTSEPHHVEPKSNPAQGIAATPRESIDQNLLVEPRAKSGNTFDQTSIQAPTQTIDKSIRFGAVYEYRAQRVARILADPANASAPFELAGPLSDPIRVEPVDNFPPDIPTGLAAVAIAANSASGAAIDLSWQPVTDPDLAGYAVYRREVNENQSSEPRASWQRISGAQPVIGPGFHDPNVEPGLTYRYAVTSIDQKNYESSRSAEAEETVPTT